MTLGFFEHRAEGVVQSFGGTTLDVAVPSLGFVRELREQSHVRVCMLIDDGLCELVLTRVIGRDGVLHGQLVGAPTYVQRRGTPRARVAVPAAAVWSETTSGGSGRMEGRTRDLSVGGAVVETDLPATELPPVGTTVLLTLWLSDGATPVTGAAEVLQVWDGGARLRAVHTPPAVAARIAAFVAAAST